MVKKVAIIIGHARDRRGADSPWLEPEWDFNTDVANALTSMNGCMYDIYFHDGYGKGYSRMIQNTANKINKKNYDLVIELHYNSAYNSSANGCSVLYYKGSQKGQKWATRMSEKISKDMNIINDGAVGLVKGNNGFLAVAYPNPPALILEPFFGSNKSDAQKFDEDYEIKKYARSIHETIIAGI